MASTIVLYPTGSISNTAEVVAVEGLPDGSVAVVLDRTSFHPLDHAWPDQPADAGTLADSPVTDLVTAAYSPDGTFLVGGEIPVRRGEPGWDWVVGHIMAPEHAPAVGAEVRVLVDAELRRSLSAAHTACHLAALALNAATAHLWRKEAPRRDSLGNPDLDGIAIQRSTITPWHSLDEYRLGKSIRKKGLDTAGLLAELPALAEAATAELRGWIQTGAVVSIETAGNDGVAARRTWRCELPQGEGRYPCGGTHVASLADLPAGTSVSYRADAEGFAAETAVA